MDVLRPHYDYETETFLAPTVPVSKVADVFRKIIGIMHAPPKFLIEWSTQETCRKNMPQIFKNLYPRVCCIIDRSKIFIERPCSYQARTQTYSNYKTHKTVKFLVGITPSGAVTFLSKCWGGRATDKCITMTGGFLTLLEPGDTILADRGSTLVMKSPFMVASL